MRRTLLALSLGLTTALASPALAQDPMTVEDLFNIKTVGQIAESPDGARIAYTLSQMPNILEGADNGRARSDVHVITASGADDRIYLPSDIGAFNLQWATDDVLMFLAAHDGKVALWKVAISGGAPEMFYEFDRSISNYRLSDDQLFFSARDESDSVGQALRARGFDANVIDEDVIFTRLYKVDLDSSDQEAELLSLDGQVSSFAISPDGQRAVVALAPTPLIGDDIINRTYHIINTRNGRVESVIGTEGKIGQAQFSPDGRHIAFLAGIDRHDPIAHTLGVADARTGEFTFLTADDEADEMDFVWSGDETLRVLIHQGTGSASYTLTTSGAVSDRVDHDGVVVTNIDGQAAMTAMSSSSPNALAIAQGGTGVQMLTHHNRWLDDRALGDQRTVRWTAADGVEVEGILVTPQGRMPRGGWPLIVLVHGGPEAHYSDGWITRYSDPGHIGAGQGYAVFYPNYRGSTGRGQHFAMLDHVDPPAAEFNDIIDGLDYLEAEGLIDRERVGITGGSYGGFASAWGATALTEHFAASVVFVALTDLTSFMGTTDIPAEMIDSHFRTFPEQDWDLYREWSPIYHASKSVTPTLILHGEDDPRVHPAQSLELYRYLDRVGQAPVRLVTYPNEGHGNRRSASQYDYSLRLYRWMDTFLIEKETTLPPYTLPQVRALGE